MECTICGKEINKLFKIEIDGNIIEVCENCKSYGKLVGVERKIERKEKLKEKSLEEFELVENYGEIIKSKREKLKISIQDLAKKIGIKESYLSKIEKGEIYPDKNTLEKLEKFLKINLKEGKEEFNIKREERKEEKLTIADVVEIK
ncbi:MAG: multiprotein bridging factor aMBF1 [Candidatus Aenigmatarchaeota archaeon]